MPPMVIVADRTDSGETLAAVLRSRCGISWSQAKRIIERKHVRVGGMIVADPSYRVRAGKRISISAGVIERPPNPDKPAKPAPAAAAVPKTRARPPKTAEELEAKTSTTKATAAQNALHKSIVILYSDDSIIVVNKPAGLTTVRHADDDAEFAKTKRYRAQTLRDLLPKVLGLQGQPIIPVHRLDRETTGVMVFARTRSAEDSLTEQFKKHTIERRYIAIVRGQAKAGRKESIFGKDRGDGRRGSVTGSLAGGGRRAVTFVRVLETLENYTLVECRLETGRTHQVRIHLGEAGTPLCGETIYDRPLVGDYHPDPTAAERPMLHAIKLRIVHPETQTPMVWEVPAPPDFSALWSKLSGR